LTQAGSFLGTPEYVAPEQATDARAADIRADIYSLGCTLYCLLAGRPPFVEDTAVKLGLAPPEKAPEPLQHGRPGGAPGPGAGPAVPGGLGAVLAKLLAKDPGQRYQTPAEVARALAPFCGKGSARPADLPPVPVARAVAVTAAAGGAGTLNLAGSRRKGPDR